MTNDLVLVARPDRDPVADAFGAALRSESVDELTHLAREHPEHPGAIDARAAIDWLRARALGDDIDTALRSLDRLALKRVASRAEGHAREPEIRAALALHERIDREVGRLDPEGLEKLCPELSRHPRRGEVRVAIRRSLANQFCGKLLSYGFRCPEALQALSEVTVAAVEVPAEAPATPVVATTTDAVPPTPVDPLAAYLDDVDAGSLARAREVDLSYIQAALKALGHYDQEVRGTRDPATTRAIRTWRSATGSGETGDLTRREIVALIKQAAGGSAEVRAYLGAMYGLGLGVRLDRGRSRELLRSAASDGFADAGAYLSSLETLWRE